MKNIVKMSLALALVATFAVSCNKEGSGSTTNAAGKMTEAAKDATAAAKDATTAAKDATAAAKTQFADMKASFTKMTESSMSDVSKEVDELKSKAATLSAEKKTEIDGLIKNITAKKDELAKMFSDAKGLSEGSTFTEMKGKIESGCAELKKLVDSAMAKLK